MPVLARDRSRVTRIMESTTLGLGAILFLLWASLDTLPFPMPLMMRPRPWILALSLGVLGLGVAIPRLPRGPRVAAFALSVSVGIVLVLHEALFWGLYAQFGEGMWIPWRGTAEYGPTFYPNSSGYHLKRGSFAVRYHMDGEGFRNTATPQHRNTATPQHRNTATPQHRNTASLAAELFFSVARSPLG